MGSLLLAVIYLIFISLGLPDSLLGSGWPKMQVFFGVPSSSLSLPHDASIAHESRITAASIIDTVLFICHLTGLTA